MTLQRNDVDDGSITDMIFFQEPANVIGNIHNAYGCFALINTQRVRLMDYVTRYHSLYGYLN